MRNLFLLNFLRIFKKNFNYKQIFINCQRLNYSTTKIITSEVVKLQENSFKVHPGFGKLLLNSTCNCIIRPASPEEHPDSNHATVTVWGIKKEGPKLEMEAQLQGEDDILKLDIYPHMREVFCEIYMPIKYDIEANMEDEASIQMEKMESDTIDVSTQRGSIRTRNVKSRDVSITTNSGSITAEEVLQGNVYINARKTTLKAKRLQGMEMCIQAGILTTDIESSYMEKGMIFAERGALSIRHLHGSTVLHLHKGKLSINGLHGSLQAIVNEGEADIQVSKITENSLVQVDSGILNLSLISASGQNLDISSPSLKVSEEIRSLGSESVSEGVFTFKTSFDDLPNLWASVSQGRLHLSIKDWFASLGIKTNG